MSGMNANKTSANASLLNVFSIPVVGAVCLAGDKINQVWTLLQRY